MIFLETSLGTDFKENNRGKMKETLKEVTVFKSEAMNL